MASCTFPEAKHLHSDYQIVSKRQPAAQMKRGRVSPAPASIIFSSLWARMHQAVKAAIQSGSRIITAEPAHAVFDIPVAINPARWRNLFIDFALAAIGSCRSCDGAQQRGAYADCRCSAKPATATPATAECTTATAATAAYTTPATTAANTTATAAAADARTATATPHSGPRRRGSDLNLMEQGNRTCFSCALGQRTDRHRLRCATGSKSEHACHCA